MSKLQPAITGPQSDFWARAFKHKGFVIGLSLSAVFVLAAAISFVWTPYDVTDLDIAAKLKI